MIILVKCLLLLLRVFSYYWTGFSVRRLYSLLNLKSQSWRGWVESLPETVRYRSSLRTPTSRTSSVRKSLLYSTLRTCFSSLFHSDFLTSFFSWVLGVVTVRLLQVPFKKRINFRPEVSTVTPLERLSLFIGVPKFPLSKLRRKVLFLRPNVGFRNRSIHTPSQSI